MQRRTRPSTLTMGGAAPDTIIGRADADRVGARPYPATRRENASIAVPREPPQDARCSKRPAQLTEGAKSQKNSSGAEFQHPGIESVGRDALPREPP